MTCECTASTPCAPCLEVYACGYGRLPNPFSRDVHVNDWELGSRLGEAIAPHVAAITAKLAEVGATYEPHRLSIVPLGYTSSVRRWVHMRLLYNMDGI